MSNIAVVTDSSADFPNWYTLPDNACIVPFRAYTGQESMLDRQEFTHALCAEYLSTSANPPSFNEPSVGDLVELYESLADDYEEIISIHLSSRLSGLYRSALVAAQMMSDRIPVTVVDSHTISLGLGMQVIEAARAINERGETSGSALAQINDLHSRLHFYLIVDSPAILEQTGYIGRPASVLSSVLQFKPILRVSEGSIVPHGKTRTRTRAIGEIQQIIAELPSIARIGLVSSVRTESWTVDQESLLDVIPESSEIYYAEISNILMTHLGIDVIGILIEEPPETGQESRIA